MASTGSYSPPLPARSHARSHPSPFQVLYLTEKKLERELASRVPNLRRLVLCAETYDKTLAHHVQLTRAVTAAKVAKEASSSPPTPVNDNKSQESRPKSRATSKRPASTGKADVTLVPKTQSRVVVDCPSTVRVFEVPEGLETSELDLFDLEDADAELIKGPATIEDLFDDWSPERNLSESDESDESDSSDLSDSESDDD